jgi:hypothetical protein
MKRIIIACSIVLGCSDRAVGDGGADGTSEGGSSSSSATATTSSTGVADTTGTSTTTTDGSTSNDTMSSGLFADSADHADDLPCDPWAQDCPEGQKCAPYANDGGQQWNDYKCVPLDPDPAQPGEPCTALGEPTSGIDDCDVASMCWNVDRDTNMGTCVPFCQGSRNAPTCADACHECAITGDGVLILCFPVCDPLASDCPDGEGCYALPSGSFACAPDVSGNTGALGEACEFTNACDAGLFCAPAPLVPDCGGAAGCCTSYCDVGAADPCPDAPMGVECVPWWEEGQEPMDGCMAGSLGACVLPP